ncbi:ABC transporter permease [Halalkalibacter urbisdiaboli]|uniref:ABC transporter permease n=1 Tax=Halalkalibacter urbisdiaboli TaxID=1960589 RepID=UPI000B44C681|nr:ABC transporter permease [Halalkalibacter urbisdiaboli]
MINFLKKDILVILRERTELFLLLLMPLLLIGILGFALKGILGGDTSTLNINVAIVHEDNEEQGIGQFVEDLNETGITEEVAPELHHVAKELSPFSLLTAVIEDDSFGEMVNTVKMDATTAEQALKDEELVAILTIPAGFTYHSLQKMLLQQGKGSELLITMNDTGSYLGTIFESSIERFVNELNFETAIYTVSKQEGIGDKVEQPQIGGIEAISTREPVSSFQYYTIGMAVMFVLYVGSTMASKAHVEKKEHAFNRILLSGTPPFAYLGGKALSASVIAFFQLTVLFGLSSLIFQAFAGETIQFWLGMALISAVVSCCVGGFAALLTACVIRFNSDSIAKVFAGGIVVIFSFAGGSFFPMSDMPEMIRMFGNWTPNGAAFLAYLQWMQEMDYNVIQAPISRMFVIITILLLASVVIFPNRRSVWS